MDIGSLNGQNGVYRTCGQRGHWAPECPKRGKAGLGGQGDDGKGQGKKDKTVKGTADGGKGQGKGGKLQARLASSFTVGTGTTWKRIAPRWAKTTGNGVKRKKRRQS